MVDPIKLSMKTARSYFQNDYAASSSSYYTQGGEVAGQWYGKFADHLGLTGAVTEAEYMRLIDGQDPRTGEQWIAIRKTYKTKDGTEVAHRPGFDLTFNPAKSFSMAALVGGDDRLRHAHGEAVRYTLDHLQPYIRARIAAHLPHENVGNGLFALFEHDLSRPVDGIPSPHLHTHAVLFNMALGQDGRAHSIDPDEIFKIQTYASAIYDWKLAELARGLGYQIEVSKGHPEIRGFTEEYLEAASRRRELIKETLNEKGLSGARAAQIIALAEREEKVKLTPEQFRQLMTGLDELHGNQAKIAVEEARHRGKTYGRPVDAEEAVNWGKAKMGERTSVFEHWEVLRDAIKYGQGTLGVDDVESNISNQVERGDLLTRSHVRQHAPGARYSTKEEIQQERDVLSHQVTGRMRAGQGGVEPILENADLGKYGLLKENSQRKAILEGILGTRDQIVGIQGAAGSAKTVSAGILREAAESAGWRVRGLAPTGKAVRALRDKGIASETLQKHNTSFRVGNRPDRTFYILDEASLVSTRQMRKFFKTLETKDHVVLIGDDDPKMAVGQHNSVEAGRIFRQLQEAGMKTAEFRKIYRQKDPALKSVVLHLRAGHTVTALSLLAEQGRIQEHGKRSDRIAALAKDYASSPEGTLIVSPDNKSRREINDAVRSAMKAEGNLKTNEFILPSLIPRDLTKAEQARAWSYRIGDTVQFISGNKELGLKAKSYATVLDTRADPQQRVNQLTVKTDAGRTLTYDPSTLKSVSVYETRLIPFAEGERVQFTAAWQTKGVHTRDTGTIVSLDNKGNAIIQIDEGSKIKANLKDHRHIDYGYVFTSHSSQSMTVRRALMHVDTGDSKLRGLHNQSFAYVAGSRPEYDLQVYTDNAEGLARELGRVAEKLTALSLDETQRYKEAMALGA